MRFVLILILWSLALPVAAEDIYREVRADGSVHFTDKAPDKKAKPIVIGPISGTIPGGSKGKKSTTFYTPEMLKQAARFAVRVESPTPGQAQSVNEAVVAAASVMPGLVKGFRLVYQVNGRAVTAQPIDELSLVLPALAPGEHELLIVLLNAKGVEVARSETARFQLRPAPESGQQALK